MFTAAMDEIYTTYTNECSRDVSVPSSRTIAELAESFKELTRRLSTISTEGLTQARAIYGRFLCYSEREVVTSTARAKRQIDLDAECKCPAASVVTLSCHFFACLSAAEIETIVGFGNGVDGFPCIGFAVDTTGSMADEISAAQRVILEFIKTQADSMHLVLCVSAIQ